MSNKINKQQKDIITSHFVKISKMDIADLIEFEKKWYLAKVDLDPKVFKWVLSGIERARKQVNETMEQSAMAVCCDVVTVD